MAFPQQLRLHNAATADANGDKIDCSKLSSVGVQISGTFTGTIYFEGSIDNTNWVQRQGSNDNTGAVATSATAVGIWTIPVGSVQWFRARLDWTSGTSCTVWAQLNEAGGGLSLADVDIVGQEDVNVAKIAGAVPQMDNTDKIAVSLYGDGGVTDLRPVACYPASQEGFTVQYSLLVKAFGSLYNGADFDLSRNNTEATPLASTARTATASCGDQTNHNARGVLVCLDVTAISDTPSVVLKIEGKFGDKYETLLLADAAVTAVGVHTYAVYPGITASDDVVEVSSLPLPRVWRVTITHADTDSITYGVNYSYIL